MIGKILFSLIAFILLIVFLEKGASKISEVYRLNSSFSDIITGIIIFFIIGSEFFITQTGISITLLCHKNSLKNLS